MTNHTYILHAIHSFPANIASWMSDLQFWKLSARHAIDEEPIAAHGV
jgi:hypothetical protein